VSEERKDAPKRASKERVPYRRSQEEEEESGAIYRERERRERGERCRVREGSERASASGANSDRRVGGAASRWGR
jgi:hypothetical protein